jgi:hypothetical protein
MTLNSSFGKYKFTNLPLYFSFFLANHQVTLGGLVASKNRKEIFLKRNFFKKNFRDALCTASL